MLGKFSVDFSPIYFCSTQRRNKKLILKIKSKFFLSWLGRSLSLKKQNINWIKYLWEVDRPKGEERARTSSSVKLLLVRSTAKKWSWSASPSSTRKNTNSGNKGIRNHMKWTKTLFWFLKTTSIKNCKDQWELATAAGLRVKPKYISVTV